MPFLELNDLSKSFGGLIAAHDVTLELESGKIVSIIGPNGAGKTTLFNLISGVIRPDCGSVIFNGVDISKLTMPNIVNLGLIRTFQQTKIFKDLTVIEAVMIGRTRHYKLSVFEALVSNKKAKDGLADSIQRSYEILEFLNLTKRADVVTQNLSYGEQKLLNIAIALAAEPKLLLLDEPAAGLNPKESMQLVELIKKISKSGITVCLVEHNMKLVMDISEKIFVLNYGQLIASGTPLEILNNDKVIEVYLGGNKHA